jgi:hypothetical protein
MNFFLAAQNLTHLKLDTAVCSIIYEKYRKNPPRDNINDGYKNVLNKLVDLSKKNSPLYFTKHLKLVKAQTLLGLFAIGLQLLSNSFAKLIKNQKQNVKCTILDCSHMKNCDKTFAVDRYHHLICSIVFAFEKERLPYYRSNEGDPF